MTEKEHVVEQTNAEPTPGIGGWLLVYLVFAVLVDVAAVVLMSCGKLSSILQPATQKNELSLFGFMILAACVMTVWVIIAFKNRKPDAVFLGRHHVIINALPVTLVLDWLLLHTDRDVFFIMVSVLFLVGLIAWRVFFNSSSQLKTLIPPATRKVSGREKLLVTFLYLAIGVLYCIHIGFDRWWITVCGFIGLLSFSPIADEFGSPDTVEKDEQDK